jgi:hypothetical protein
LISVAVGIDPIQAELRRSAGEPFVSPELVSALIDTGAGTTLIDLRLTRLFDLEPTGMMTLRLIGGTRLIQTYDIGVHFTIPRMFSIPEPIRAIGYDLSALDVQVLIGRNLLRYCRFGYNGPAGVFTLDY